MYPFSYAAARSYRTASHVTTGILAKIPLIAHDIFPIVDTLRNGLERFSYIHERQTRGIKSFIQSRAGDPRENQLPLSHVCDLYLFQKFIVTCIDEPEKLEPMYHKYKEHDHCIFHRDICSREQWLEILPEGTSKRNAIRQLMKHLECDQLVVFGDEKTI